MQMEQQQQKHHLESKKIIPIDKIPTYEDFHDKTTMNMEVFHTNWNQY